MVFYLKQTVLTIMHRFWKLYLDFAWKNKTVYCLYVIKSTVRCKVAWFAPNETLYLADISTSRFTVHWLQFALRQHISPWWQPIWRNVRWYDKKASQSRSRIAFSKYHCYQSCLENLRQNQLLLLLIFANVGNADPEKKLIV